MNTLLSRLVVYINTCLKKDVSYEIAQYIIEHYIDCKAITLQSLCEECYVSRASVTRFCKLFGFSSWSTFHQHLIRTKRIRDNQLLERFQVVDMEKEYTRISDIIGNPSSAFMKSLQAVIQTIIDAMQKSRKIYLFGAIYPLSIATAFQIDMIGNGKVVYCDFQSEISKIEDLHQDDIAIILTATGRYIHECKDKFNRICQSPAKQVIISCSDRYKEMQYIDYYLHIPASQKGGIKDFDYYVMAILDIFCLEYQYQCIGRKQYATT